MSDVASTVGIRLAHLPELPLEGMLLCYANLLRLSWGKIGVRAMLCPGDRLLIEVFDRFGPTQQWLIAGILLFELMDIA